MTYLIDVLLNEKDGLLWPILAAALAAAVFAAGFLGASLK